MKPQTPVSKATSHKTVLITGASSGIGLQLARDYLHKGYQVIACGRSHDKLESLRLESSSSMAQPLQTLNFDIGQRDEVLAAATQISGQLDLLILNAGTCEYLEQVIPFDSALFERVVQTNLLGTAYCLEAFLGLLKRPAQVAFVSSSATFLPFTKAQAYGASKAGMSYLARSLAVDLAAQDISVHLINPGFVATPLTDRNDFAMPMCISAEQAAQTIIRGLEKNQRHIRMPWFFTRLLGLLSLLPYSLQHDIALRIKK